MELTTSPRAKTAVFAVVAALALAGCGSKEASGDSVAESDVIKLGSTSGISGPAGAYGKSLSDGQQAIFRSVNDAGGINGRKIDFTLLDDALDVSRAVQNVRTLVADANVAIVGGSGAGSIDAIVPILNKAKVPLLFPAKSSPAFVNDVVPYAFAGIPTFPDQAAAVVKAAFKRTGPGSVYLVETVSDQNDAILSKVKAAVSDGGGEFLGTSIVPFGADVAPAGLQLRQKRPDYVIFTSAPAETTKLAQYLASNNTLPAKGLLGVTSLPGETFAQGTDKAAHSLVLSLSATNPSTDSSAAECNTALAKYFPKTKADSVTVFGCSIAQMVVAGLKAAGDDLTADGIVRALEAMESADVSAVIPAVSFSPTSHIGLTSLPAVTLQGTEWVTVETVPVPVLP